MATLRCRRKPVRAVSGYSRCPRNKAGPRKSWRQRKAKVCRGSASKLRVGGHRRKVCVGLHVR